MVDPVIAYLDTNAAVWLAQGDMHRISQAAREIMEVSDLLIFPMVLTSRLEGARPTYRGVPAYPKVGCLVEG